MDAGFAHTTESLFGPASEVIDVFDFLQSATNAIEIARAADPPTIPAEIAEECSIEEIRGFVTDTWNNPTLSGHLVRDHDRIVSALHSTAISKSKSVRKTHLPDPETLSTEVNTLQKNMDNISLKSFRLDADAVLFMRTSMNSDYNVLTNTRCAATSDTVEVSPEGVVIFSIHDKIPWGPSYVTRSSQHALLCSQTLHDLYDRIPCISKQLPTDNHTRCLICIEGMAFSYHTEGEDYADKLIGHLASVSKPPRSTTRKATTNMKETKISSLSIRINEPYWLIHSGNCEHFILFNQIRLIHPSDHRLKYPMTTQISPVLMDLCRACNKVPAIWSIVGDIRLGESPCVLCGPCWRQMGESDHDTVLVIPLLRGDNPNLSAYLPVPI